MAYDKKKLDTLVRQGLMPAKQLPILHRALDKLKSNQNLNPYEREAISKLLDKTMGFNLGDDITFNRVKLHTQRTRYQTEEQDMDDKESKVVVHDGTEDEAESKRDKKAKKKAKSEFAEASGNRPADKQEVGDKESPKQGGSEDPEVGELCGSQDSKPPIKEEQEDERSKMERRFAKALRTKSRLPKELSKDVRKEKEKAGLSEDLAKFNELYKENLDRALANNKVDNVRDIPEKIKQDLFKHVEEATYSGKQIRMAKGIAFDKRYKGGNMTGAAKQMEKIKKGLSDHPDVSKALRQANEEKMATKDHDGDGKIESGKDEYMGSRDKAIKKAMAKRKGIKETVLDVMLGEGAREDAMRDMKSKDATKGMAPTKKEPKPGKSKHDGSENKGPAHIVAQLRGVLDQGDKHGGVKFRDGSTHKVSVNHAHKFLNKYMSGKPADKLKMQDHGHASHDNFKKHLD